MRRQDQIEGSIVIEVGDPQPYIAGKIVGCVGHSGDFSRFPALSFVLVRNANDSAVSLYRQQVENAVVIGVRGCNRLSPSGNWRVASARGTVPGARS